MINSKFLAKPCFVVDFPLLVGLWEDDVDDCNSSEDVGVVEVGYDVERVGGGQAACNEHLCAVGDDALCHAAEGVEDAGGASGGDAVLLGYASGQRSYAQDGDGVVGGAEVSQHYQGCHAELGTSATLDAVAEYLHEPVDASGQPNDLHESCCHEGDYDEFAHAHDAVVHGTQPSEGRQRPAVEADDAGQERRRGQDEHHVHAAQGCHYYIYIRYNGRVGDGAYLVGFHADGRQTGVESQTDEGCGQGYADVGAELVLHPASLRLSGNNGCVGDEAQVVAEVCSAHHDGYHHGRAGVCLACHAAGDGHKGGDGADAGSGAERDEAGCHEETAQQEAGRHSNQGQSYGGVDGSHLFGRGGKGACQDEYPQHLHDAGRGGTFRQMSEALANGLSAHDEQAVEAGCQKCHGDGDGIEVVGNDAQQQVEHQEHDERA